MSLEQITEEYKKLNISQDTVKGYTNPLEHARFLKRCSKMKNNITVYYSTSSISTLEKKTLL